jgi:hypothetical protein
MSKYPAFPKRDVIFETTALTYHEQVHVRGKPLDYLMYAINIFKNFTDAKVIVEVGSIRQRMTHAITNFNPECCNDGHSTYFWKHYTDAEIYSVDIDPSCKNIIENDERLSGVNVFTHDANSYLVGFDKQIDLLFLDAWDVQEGTPYAEEHLRAYLTCKDKLAKRCLILIDDTDIGNKGKGRLVIPRLIEDGFECLTEGRQTLFVRN